ncbi:MAG: phosphopyruvate hydratase [Candidatus Hermodarchaeia archaeon]|jgi:enolase
MANPYIIKEVRAMEILDSRGNPTVQTEVLTQEAYGRAMVPSGASTGKYEAVELRDKDAKRFHGRGVQKAIDNILTILAPAIIGMDAREQQTIDAKLRELDGTPNKSRLGANAILGVSLAVAKAAADTGIKHLFEYLSPREEYVLPVPLMNIINGGVHAGNQLAIQEFMIMPVGFDNFHRALQAGIEIYHTLGKVLKEKYGPVGVNLGDEGGFAPPMQDTREALDAVVIAIEQEGYKPGKEIGLALDAAANEFHTKGQYSIDSHRFSPGELFDFYRELSKEYPLISIEDPFEENDFESFSQLTQSIGQSVQIVGDDIFVSNSERLQKGIDMGAANSLLLKVNQVGTLTEAIEAAQLAGSNDYTVVVSHRSGETENTFIADLAVALSCGQIKTGAPARGERTAKYNRLTKITHDLGRNGQYAGNQFRKCKVTR